MVKDNIIEAITKFKTYMDSKYDTKKYKIEDYSISDTDQKNIYAVRLGSKKLLAGYTKYDEKKNMFLGFNKAQTGVIRPRQDLEIGDILVKKYPELVLNKSKN